MKKKFICSLLAGLSIVTAGFLSVRHIAAEEQAESNPLAVLAREATSANASESAAAIKVLRATGAEGLKTLSDVYSNQMDEHALHLAQAGNGKFSAPDKNWERISAAFDAVGQQRDCAVSQLYWFTDLDQAKAAAHASGKPIISLRLLGKLDEEYSCANSRFFRTTLYANAEVSAYLRDHFILHWQSVRPVPRITIDMGDGRKIERTITGNSIHYVLDADGNPIDALPGLYGAKAFLDGLKNAETAEQQAAKLNGGERETFLKNYHETRLAEIQRQFSRDLAQVGGAGTVLRPPVAMTTTENPDAIAAGSRAMSKGFVEMPMLRSGAQTVTTAVGSQPDAISDDTWKAVAALHADDSALDGNAYGLVASKLPHPAPTAAEAMPRTASKALVETPMLRTIDQTVDNLQNSIAEDTVRNEYLFHTRIHEWLAGGGSTQDLDALNKRVYAELFLTPDSDPWLGLAPADTFSALDNGGLVQNSTAR
jgi:hypothetical protein